jgi:hypothetical protein
VVEKAGSKTGVASTRFGRINDETFGEEMWSWPRSFRRLRLLIQLRRGAGSFISVGVAGSRTTAMVPFAGCLTLAPGELRPRDSASDVAGRCNVYYAA